MIKYKIIQVIGNKEQIFELDSQKFDNNCSALISFMSINVYLHMIEEWGKATKNIRELLIDTNTFIGYELVEYDTDDESDKIVLDRKSASFRDNGNYYD